jgi:hypothetical protein
LDERLYRETRVYPVLLSPAGPARLHAPLEWRSLVLTSNLATVSLLFEVLGMRTKVPFSAMFLASAGVIVALSQAGCKDDDPSESGGEGSGEGSGTGSDSGTGTGNGTGGGTGGDNTTEDGSGTACGEPPPGFWGDCVNEGNGACEDPADHALCLQNDPNDPAWGVCSRLCETVCDCWAPHPEGAAEPACSRVLSTDTQCVLDCKGGKDCPDGMRCSSPNAAVSLCVFDIQG